MTAARKLQVATALALGVILPVAATLWFAERLQVAHNQSIVGKQAPDFEVATLRGEYHTLSTYEGRRLALLFVDFDCPACVQQLGYLDKLSREVLGPPDLEMLAVSESSDERTSGFAGDFTLSFPLVVDCGSMRSGYRVTSEPTLVLIDERGIVRFSRGGSMRLGMMRRLIHGFAVEGKIALEAVVAEDADE